MAACVGRQTVGARFRSRLRREAEERGGSSGDSAPHSAAALPLAPTDLSADECVSLLRSLLERYREPGFVAELTQARARAARGEGETRLLVGTVVLRVQAPVLAAHGLAPDGSGVEAMKHAVLRRIAEGAPNLRDLANEARRALGLPKIPNLGADHVDEYLVAMADADGSHTLAGAALEHALAATTAGARELVMRELTGGLPRSCASAMISMARVGLPLGAISGDAHAAWRVRPHVPVLVSTSRGELPISAQEFYDGYVARSLPCVLRGAIDASTFAPLSTFADFSHLRAVCGHRRVPVKSVAINDAQGNPCFVDDPELRVPLVDFLAQATYSDLLRLTQTYRYRSSTSSRRRGMHAHLLRPPAVHRPRTSVLTTYRTVYPRPTELSTLRSRRARRTRQRDVTSTPVRCRSAATYPSYTRRWWTPTDRHAPRSADALGPRCAGLEPEPRELDDCVPRAGRASGTGRGLHLLRRGS